MTVTAGPTAAARRDALRRLLQRRVLRSQAEIGSALSRYGHRVTQTTVSRDLAALGAVKETDRDGEPRYVLASAGGAPAGTGELPRILRQFVVDVTASGNLVVVRALPGSAAPIAAELDRTRLERVVGTVAGDDTVLVVARSPSEGGQLAREIERLWRGSAKAAPR